MTKDQARQRVIAAMCPEKVCKVCGEPSRRIVDHERTMHLTTQDDGTTARQIAAHGKSLNNFAPSHGYTVTRETLGWSDCGHDDWRPGVVLDPFADD